MQEIMECKAFGEKDLSKRRERVDLLSSEAVVTCIERRMLSDCVELNVIIDGNDLTRL